MSQQSRSPGPFFGFFARANAGQTVEPETIVDEEKKFTAIEEARQAAIQKLQEKLLALSQMDWFSRNWHGTMDAATEALQEIVDLSIYVPEPLHGEYRQTTAAMRKLLTTLAQDHRTDVSSTSRLLYKYTEQLLGYEHAVGALESTFISKAEERLRYLEEARRGYAALQEAAGALHGKKLPADIASNYADQIRSAIQRARDAISVRAEAKDAIENLYTDLAGLLPPKDALTSHAVSAAYEVFVDALQEVVRFEHELITAEQEHVLRQ